MRPSSYINVKQRCWANRHGIVFDDKGYVLSLGDNLFMPLSADASGEFLQGAGDELRKNMLALHSSSALVVNVFDYWRHLGKLNTVLPLLKPGIGDVTIRDFRFEAQLPINWPNPPARPTTPPHLDLVIRYQTGQDQTQPGILAVESKYCEPYGQDQGGFADRYLDPLNDAMWEGLKPLHNLATSMRAERVFRRLKAAQLVKHILGLRSQFPNQPFELLYLWYDVPGPEATQHAHEIRQFAQLTGECGLNFRSLTYQEMLQGVAAQRQTGHRQYVDYLMERYF
jgi:hypothetical protein